MALSKWLDSILFWHLKFEFFHWYLHLKELSVTSEVYRVISRNVDSQLRSITADCLRFGWSLCIMHQKTSTFKKKANILWDDVYFSQKYAIYAAFRILNEQQLLTRKSCGSRQYQEFFLGILLHSIKCKVFLAIYGMFYSPSMEYTMSKVQFLSKKCIFQVEFLMSIKFGPGPP